MSLRYRLFNWLGATLALVGMVLAAPGAALILASDWCTDLAADQQRDLGQGGGQ